MSNTKLPRGNKQIAFRVEPGLEQAMKQAMEIDGDESISAWLKRVIRKELKSRNIEPNS
ncbi:TPA: hypothetical protein ACSR1A_003835 [Enterobacter hormaechei subsp. hoffmannii]